MDKDGPSKSIDLRKSMYICSFCKDEFPFRPHKCDECTKI